MVAVIPTAPLERFFLALFLLSTPISCIAVFVYNGDRMWWALANSYGFSLGMLHQWSPFATSLVFVT